MPSYNITNTAGSTVATIGVATTTGASFPIELIGQGISLYGPTIARSQYQMLENFALPTPPSAPVTGMFWYKSDTEVPHFYNGANFIPLSTARSGASVLFNMLPAADNIDFTSTAVTGVFQAPGSGEKFHPTGLVLVPVGSPTATGPAACSLFVSGTEDVLETVIIDNAAANVHYYFSIEGKTRFIESTETLNLEVTTGATGGTLNMKVYVFGFTTT